VRWIFLCPSKPGWAVAQPAKCCATHVTVIHGLKDEFNLFARQQQAYINDSLSSGSVQSIRIWRVPSLAAPLSKPQDRRVQGHAIDAQRTSLELAPAGLKRCCLWCSPDTSRPETPPGSSRRSPERGPVAMVQNWTEKLRRRQSEGRPPDPGKEKADDEGLSGLQHSLEIFAQRICGPALVTPAYVDQINSESRMNWPRAHRFERSMRPARRSGGSLHSRAPALPATHCYWIHPNILGVPDDS